MKLRDHPLMNYRGLSNWPPRWLPRGEGIGPRVYGEVGVLTEVTVYHLQPNSHESPQLFLLMEHHSHRYIAAVLFSDRAFCAQIGELLKKYHGHSLEEIGGIDVSHLL
jgi:hypothetical protein